jgi:hypothetical protein
MAVSAAQLDAVAACLQRLPCGAHPVAALRRDVQGLTFVCCEADDLRGETPFRRLPAFDLFLIDAQRHCWELVDHADRATGLVLARRAPGAAAASAA